MVEAGIRDWFGQQLLEAKEAIGGQGILRGAMTIFYLLGPFFMLIERSPADAWLTLCGLAFRCDAWCDATGHGQNFSGYVRFWSFGPGA